MLRIIKLFKKISRWAWKNILCYAFGIKIIVTEKHDYQNYLKIRWKILRLEWNANFLASKTASVNFLTWEWLLSIISKCEWEDSKSSRWFDKEEVVRSIERQIVLCSARNFSTFSKRLSRIWPCFSISSWGLNWKILQYLLIVQNNLLLFKIKMNTFRIR